MLAQILSRVYADILRLWRWSAKWKWYSGLFGGFVIMIGLHETAVGIFLLFLSAFGILSELWHWRSRVSDKSTIIGKIGGSLLISVLLGAGVYIARAEKGTSRWSHFPPMKNTVVSAPNRAHLQIASMYPEIDCLTGTLRSQNVTSGASTVIECTVIAKVEIGNFGPSPILPKYSFQMKISLQKRFLEKAEEDELFRDRDTQWGTFDIYNSLNTNEKSGFTARSHSYIGDEASAWERSSRLMMVMAQAWYGDDSGELFTEQCFYVFPPDFDVNKKTKCKGHNDTYSERPSYW